MIYVVMTGEYSDVGVSCVCADEAMAEAWAEMIGGWVERYEVDERSSPEKAKCFKCCIDVSTGKITEYKRQHWILLGDGRRGWTDVNTFIDYGDGKNREVTVIGAYSKVSMEHAKKLAVEGRQKHLRTQEAQ